MSHTSHATIASPADQARALPLLIAALLGLVIIGMVGFSHMDVMHNAGHDYRHSMAFPCH